MLIVFFCIRSQNLAFKSDECLSLFIKLELGLVSEVKLGLIFNWRLYEFMFEAEVGTLFFGRSA